MTIQVHSTLIDDAEARGFCLLARGDPILTISSWPPATAG